MSGDRDYNQFRQLEVLLKTPWDLNDEPFLENFTKSCLQLISRSVKQYKSSGSIPIIDCLKYLQFLTIFSQEV